MTTKITVDAHAGWPVRITAQKCVNGEWIDNEDDIITVEPHTTHDVYVWDDKRIVIQELKKDA